MNMPRAGQKVQLEGRKEVFVVLRVDQARYVADLLRLGSVRKVEAGVSLMLLHPVNESGQADDLHLSA